MQLPPRWKRNTSRLDEFLEVATRTGWRWAVELRLYRSYEPVQRPLLEDEGHVLEEGRRLLR